MAKGIESSLRNLKPREANMGSRGEVPCLGVGDEIPNVTHARSANKKAKIGAEPKATITILIHSDRTLLWIPTGCALRWAQRDWKIRISPGNSHSRDVSSLLAIPDAPISVYGRSAHGLRRAAAQTCLGISSPRSTLVGQGGSDNPLDCHSLPPQFGKAEPPDPFFASRRF